MQRRGMLAAPSAAIAMLFGRKGAAQDAAALPSRQEIEALLARMRDALPYPRVTTTGADALAEWERLRAEGKGWPVIVGDDEGLERIAEQFSLEDPAVFPSLVDSPHPPPPQRSPAEILAAAASVKLPEGLRGWMGLTAEEQAEEYRPEIGEWPPSAEKDGPGLTIASDILTGKPFERVHILVLPTRDSTEVPAYLRWGGWNACPPPEVHVALLRDWKARYGAELVAINGDTINLRVKRRPATREEALALAREQFLYCEDIVSQGTETLAPLARGLMDSDWWFFWWD